MLDFTHLQKDLDALQALGLPYCEVVVRRNHQLLFQDHRGTEGLGKRVFLYSCSKLFTVTGVLRLVERGVIGLDDPVSKYLPAFGRAFVMENGAPRPPRNTMTLRHLFTMSAGLDYNLQTAPIQAAIRKADADTISVVNAIPESPLCFDPGDRFQYSLCHDVLAAVAEAATGKPFAEYMAQEVFAPLGMQRTSYTYTEEELAPQYLFDADARVFQPYPNACGYILSPHYYSGGAGIIGCASELSLLVDALACGGQTADGYSLLRPETIRQLAAPQLGALLQDPAFECAAGPGYSYGLGVRTLIDRSDGQRSPLGEFGWDGAAGSYEMCDPVNGISIAFTTQVRGWPAIRKWLHAPLRDAVYQDIFGI